MTPGLPMTFESILQSDPNYTGSRFDLRFGQGPDGTLYIMNKNNGWIYEGVGTVVAVPEPGMFGLATGALVMGAAWMRARARRRS
jgi:hypothetical protein